MDYRMNHFFYIEKLNDQLIEEKNFNFVSQFIKMICY